MAASSPLFWTLGFSLVATSASAVAVSLDGLVTDSPFVLKQAENATPVATEGAAVEFRGVIATKEGVFFGLYDRAKNTGAWVRQDDKDADFKVSGYDAAGDLVTVDYQGQRFTLPLSSAKIGAAAPSPLPVVNSGQPASAGGRVTAVPAGGRANDQQRLESVAAEVRRRRALRQASSPGAAQAQPTPARQ